MGNNSFHYEYSAPTTEERKEIASIRKKYIPQEPTKLDKLRSLDKKVRGLPTAVALTVGIVSCLVFGLGLTLILEWSLWLGGIPVAAVGTVGMLLAYPLHTWVRGRMKRKYGEEILALSNELLQN